MTRCDICGMETSVRSVQVEGATMNACFYCVEGKKEDTRRGDRGNFQRRDAKRVEFPKQDRVLLDDYAVLVKDTRERRGLKQEDVAKIISEHESIVHRIESGTYKPGMRVARKLERCLKVRLTRRTDEEEAEEKKNVELVIEKKKVRSQGINAGMTIGDIIKFK